MKWFLFEHAVKLTPSNGRLAIGFVGAHLSTGGNAPAPACGMLATHLPRTSEPTGFVPACALCLALSEVRHV